MRIRKQVKNTTVVSDKTYMGGGLVFEINLGCDIAESYFYVIPAHRERSGCTIS
jgi:hypothetical protein